LEQQSIQVGLVGYGYASMTFHAPLIKATEGMTLAAVSSSKPEMVKSQQPQARVHPTPEALFADPAIELVVIATPNDSHHPLAKQALEQGKHVVIDKPFTIDAAQARDLIDTARHCNRLLSVFHNRRWDGDFLTVRQLVEQGTLGRLTHFESHFDRYRPLVQTRWREAGGPGSGLWYDLGVHLADQAMQLFGMPTSIQLDLARQREGAMADDWFHAVLHFGGTQTDALRVILHASALTARPAPRFVVHGTQGSYYKLGLDTQEDALKAGLPVGGANWGRDDQTSELSLNVDGAIQTAPHPVMAGAYPAYYRAMADAIRHGAAVPVDPSGVVKVMELIGMGLESASESRVVHV
jgi:predicted dehydrogenase